MQRLRSEQSGFTLIEILVASITIAILVVSITTAFNTVEIMDRRARNITTATQIVQQQIEGYRSTPFNQLVVGSSAINLSGYPQLGSPKSGTATLTQIDPAGLDQLDVVVSYTESGKTKTVEITTQITQRGIDR